MPCVFSLNLSVLKVIHDQAHFVIVRLVYLLKVFSYSLLLSWSWSCFEALVIFKWTMENWVKVSLLTIRNLWNFTVFYQNLTESMFCLIKTHFWKVKCRNKVFSHVNTSLSLFNRFEIVLDWINLIFQSCHLRWSIFSTKHLVEFLLNFCFLICI